MNVFTKNNHTSSNKYHGTYLSCRKARSRQLTIIMISLRAYFLKIQKMEIVFFGGPPGEYIVELWVLRGLHALLSRGIGGLPNSLSSITADRTKSFYIHIVICRSSFVFMQVRTFADTRGGDMSLIYLCYARIVSF